jgi:5'-3' exoribonuclease 2
MDDFVCFCFLLGNDFLPGQEAIDIHDGAIDVSLDVTD